MLSNIAKRYLRGLGHHLDAIIQIGKSGADAGVCKAASEALLTHELIKVKVNQNAEGEREELVAALAGKCGADVVQIIGRTALLYKAHPEEPAIVLPESTQKLRRLQRKPR